MITAKHSFWIFLRCYVGLLVIYLLCCFFLNWADYGVGCMVSLLVSGMVAAGSFVKQAQRIPDNDESWHLIGRCMLWSYVASALLLIMSGLLQYGFQYLVEFIILFIPIILVCSLFYILFCIGVLWFCFNWFIQKVYFLFTRR